MVILEFYQIINAMKTLNLQNIRQAETLFDELQTIRSKMESRINLDVYTEGKKQIGLNNSKIMRICLLAGLSSNEPRKVSDYDKIQLSANRIFETLFTHHNLTSAILALFKLRYNDLKYDWKNDPENSRIVNAEIIRGAKLLSKDEVLDEWLLNTNKFSEGRLGAIPSLYLNIGNYEDDIPAILNLNGKEIPNTQILVAGTTAVSYTHLI